MKLTQKHFEIFKKECLKWIDFFGLVQWQIHFTFKSLENRAQIAFNCVSGCATIILSSKWEENSKDFINDYNIRKAAFHEVCELLLGRLNDMVSQRYGLNEGDVDEEIHRIIRTLENKVFTTENHGSKR